MYLITTSRPYTNARPHIGTAIDAVWGDAFNRFFGRLKDGNTYFTMGTDEHSFKIADKAHELGIAPKEFVDEKYTEFKEFYDSLDIVADQFVQSSDLKHYWFSNLVWDKLEAKGLIYKKTYSGLYCKGCEDFYAPSQLVDGHCPIHINLEIQHIDEENYFFKLSAFKDEILDYLTKVNVPDKSVIVEMKNFAEDLEDISISRDRSRLSVDWGIPVNKHPEHVIYVWFEALLTYITPMIDDDLWDEWQKAEDKTEVEKKVWAMASKKLPQNLQIIGRDNAKFHLIIYPAILSGLDLPKIETCLIHGMITDSLGRKFAKSLGNGFEIDDFIAKFGTEGVRFFVLHDTNPTGDTSFDWQRSTDSYNSNLADNFGNLVVRVTNLVEKNLNGFVDLDDINFEDLIDLNGVYASLSNFDTQRAMQELFLQCTKINQYLEETRPWELAKDTTKNAEKIKQILNLSTKSLIEISKALAIFLPATGDKVYEILTGDRIEKAPILFPKVELE
jgi:methionyl-tRNA synthetase